MLRPGGPEGGSHPRTIMHVDVDCFYAQSVTVRNPGLRGKPVAIQQKNIVVTCNYEARKYGVTKLQNLDVAKSKCDDLVVVLGQDLTEFREDSLAIRKVLRAAATALHPQCIVEHSGMDELYVDLSPVVADVVAAGAMGGIPITDLAWAGNVVAAAEVGTSEPARCPCGCVERVKVASHFAAALRKRVFDELGFTVSAGVSDNKLRAKLAAARWKPNQQTLLVPALAPHLIAQLPVRAVPGIGRSLSKRMKALCMGTVALALKFPRRALMDALGEADGAAVFELLRGQDNSLVEATGAPKSISDMDSFKQCSTMADTNRRILFLCTGILKRLDFVVGEFGCHPTVLSFGVRLYFGGGRRNSKTSTKQGKVPAVVFDRKDPHRAATLSAVCLAYFKALVPGWASEKFHCTWMCVTMKDMVDKPLMKASIHSFFGEHAAPESTDGGGSGAPTLAAPPPAMAGAGVAAVPTPGAVASLTWPPVASTPPQLAVPRAGGGLPSTWWRPRPAAASPQAPPTNALEPPPGVAKDVFDALPEDVQREVIASQVVRPPRPKGLRRFFAASPDAKQRRLNTS